MKLNMESLGGAVARLDCRIRSRETFSHRTSHSVLCEPLPAAKPNVLLIVCDDLVRQILEVIDSTALKDKTIVVFTSDHGWGNGEKDDTSTRTRSGRRARGCPC